MTALAQAHRIANAEAELLSYRRALPGARNEGERREMADRIRNLEADLVRFRAGKLTAKD
jgi:hypothetical protein